MSAPVAGARGSTPVLEMVAVTHIYPGPPETVALREVNLSVDEGEMVAIVGPSGSGKSTLLHLMGGLDSPSAGAVRLSGTDTAGLNDEDLSALRGRTIGFVFQQFHLLSTATALENVAAPLSYQGIPRRDRNARAAELLRHVGLGQRARHRPGQLSGGERQRVAIARALAGEPAVVLADEPTGNLDSKSGQEVINLFEQLNAAGTTVVMITHDPSVAEHCKRELRLVDGRLADPDVSSPDPYLSSALP